uniref:Galectin n=1 Tax=Monopterus albus TaxID=43700 RepID=A0A3Q3ISX1_MONAL
MTFKEGHEFKIRIKPNDGCCSFAINIGHDPENIALHFNPRFDSEVIVCNSLSGGIFSKIHLRAVTDRNFSPSQFLRV